MQKITTPNRFDFVTYRGDTFEHCWEEIADCEGNLYDFTGFSAKMALVHKGEVKHVFESEITTGQGKICINIPAANHADMLPLKYQYDLQLTLGSDVFTVFAGFFTITNDITK